MKNEYRILVGTEDAAAVKQAIKSLPHTHAPFDQYLKLDEIKVGLNKYDFLYLRLTVPSNKISIFDNNNTVLYGDLIDTSGSPF